eukprot:Seg447.9 transcript_id=Seg447.9/GoldUCD/mRNA.D3Y31 product="hypothetical protein" protein_id=Seg447.9/GoldUCD/D3Y31
MEKEPYPETEPEVMPLQVNGVQEAPPPPRYNSQVSIEKKPPSDDPDSFDDYNEDSRFNEDGSFIGQYGEEKRREAEEEEDSEDDGPDDSTFV